MGISMGPLPSEKRPQSPCGAFVAMIDCLQVLREQKVLTELPVRDFLAAVSVGMVRGIPAVDLVYEEDAKADVDMNVIMTGQGRFVEIQGTAEREPFDQRTLTKLLGLAGRSIDALVALQRKTLGIRTFSSATTSRRAAVSAAR